MKKSFDNAKLLDAALADESWESCNRRLRSQGLAALQAAKQTRRGWATVGQIAAMIGVIVGLWWTFNGMTGSPRNAGTQVATFDGVTQLASRTVSKPTRASMANHQSDIASGQMRGEGVSQEVNQTYITEEQMMAMFPKGSCVLAEINGQKELVIFGGKETAAGDETAEAKSGAKL